MSRTDQLRPKTVHCVLAATFAIGTVVYLVATKPERASAVKAGLFFLGFGLVLLGFAALSARIMAGKRSDEMTEYSSEYYQSAAEVGPVAATAMQACAAVLLLSTPLLS